MRKQYMCDAGKVASWPAQVYGKVSGQVQKRGNWPVHVKFSGKMGNNLGQYMAGAHLSRIYGDGNVALNMDKGCKQKLNTLHNLFPRHPKEIEARDKAPGDKSGFVESMVSTPPHSTCTPEVQARIKALGLVLNERNACRNWGDQRHSWCRHVADMASSSPLHVKGQYFAHELWMRYGNAMRKEVIAALAPPTLVSLMPVTPAASSSRSSASSAGEQQRGRGGSHRASSAVHGKRLGVHL